MAVENNRLHLFKWSSFLFGDKENFGSVKYEENMGTVKYIYTYNNNSLLTNIDWSLKNKTEDKSSQSNFKYNFKNKIIDVKQLKTDKKFTLKLGENNQIRQIKSKNNKIDFIDFKIDRITNFNDAGQIENDYDYTYKNNNLIELKETTRFKNNSSNYESYNFTYNKQGFVIQINNNTDKKIKDIHFEYTFDKNNNWTNLKFQLDRKYYKKAKIVVENIKRKREKIAENLKGYDKIMFLLDDKELVDAKVNRDIIGKHYSSQIEIKRNITYYDK